MKAETYSLSLDKRLLFYRVLADCYYPPSKKLLEQLHDAGKLSGEPFAEILRHMLAQGNLDILAVDFARLFVGPFELLTAPYGSVYMEARQKVMGATTIDAKNIYRKEGLGIDIKEAPDHIAVELEFMYFLVYKQGQALVDPDSREALKFLEKQSYFLKNHLGRWVPQFTDKVKAHAQTCFYKDLAQITGLFIQQELDSLSG